MPKLGPMRKFARRLALSALFILGAAGHLYARASLEGSSAKPAYYATSAACAAAKIFSPQQCDNAFRNAFAEMRARQLAFPSRIDCIVQFHLCERDGLNGTYAPLVLGVEIVQSRGGGFATPVLAAPTPQGLLPPQPIVRLQEDLPLSGNAAGRLALLPTDHFERVDPNSVREAWAHFRGRDETVLPSLVADAPMEPDEAQPFERWRLRAAKESATPKETPEQRRARLQKAPFIE